MPPLLTYSSFLSSFCMWLTLFRSWLPFFNIGLHFPIFVSVPLPSTSSSLSSLIQSCHFDAQVTSLVRSCFTPLRPLPKNQPISSPGREKVIQAFSFSRLDYCNALHSGIRKNSFHRLQMIQNAAAGLKQLGTNRRGHITMSGVHSLLFVV